MENMTIILLCSIIASAGCIGGFFLARLLQPTRPAPVVRTVATAQVNTTQQRIQDDWLTVQTHVALALANASDRVSGLDALTHAVQRIFPDAMIFCLIPEGAPFPLGVTIGDDTRESQNYTTFSQPMIARSQERDLADLLLRLLQEFQREIRGALPARELAPDLPERLDSRFHLTGPGIVTPLIVDQQLLGVLLICSTMAGRTPEAYDASVASVGGLGALFTLWLRRTLFQPASEADEVSTAQVVPHADVLAQCIQMLATISQIHSVLAYRKPTQVMELSERLAEMLEVPLPEIASLRMAAMTCDIGMIGIPTAILRKQEDLTEDEWKLVKTHPALSISILKHLTFFAECLPIIRHHHERWDGMGYPDKLAGDDIPLAAQILAVADSYITMQIKRPNRPIMSEAEALSKIEEGAGTLYAPAVVAALVTIRQSSSTEAIA